MTLDEYHKAAEALRQEYSANVTKLAKEYALSNNTVKIGDIVTGNTGSIVVNKINISICRSIPQCIYRGVRLTKKGTPFKSGEESVIYQSNVIKVQEGQK